MTTLTKKEKALLKPIFWDIDIDNLDYENHKRYTIERILQYGLTEHINWMLEHFDKEDIAEAVKKSRSIDRKTANYWSIHLEISKDEILCFTNQSAMSNSMF
ncbi:MAG: hypothetical protein M3R36_14770 [Bacteroidota bacterium]|nr:hypothetical protein [Bacteroidota bacterium]